MPSPDFSASPPPVAVVVSRYNASITDRLVEGALQAYAGRGGRAEDVHIFDAPGAYELPALALTAVETGRYRGIVALGCLIRGQTRHDRYIADAVAYGLMQVALNAGVPCAFGVLTVETPKQARARAGGEKGNKGAEAMIAVLDAIASVEAIRAGKPNHAAAEPGHPDKAAAELSEVNG